MSDRWRELARYNAERARGIVHTPEWRERMRVEQEWFDWEQRRKVGYRGTPPPPHPKVSLPPATEPIGIPLLGRRSKRARSWWRS